MKPTRLYPEHLAGRSFLLRDLRLALAWAQRNPAIRLHIMLDHLDIDEVIEIYEPNARFPRWLIWNTHAGRLRVDDLPNGEFGLPFLTVGTALDFIASKL